MDWFQFAVAIITPILQASIKNPISLVKEIHVLQALSVLVNNALAAALAAQANQVVPSNAQGPFGINNG